MICAAVYSVFSGIYFAASGNVIIIMLLIMGSCSESSVVVGVILPIPLVDPSIIILLAESK